jgi:hypothetical protein
MGIYLLIKIGCYLKLSHIFIYSKEMPYIAIIISLFEFMISQRASNYCCDVTILYWFVRISCQIMHKSFCLFIPYSWQRKLLRTAWRMNIWVYILLVTWCKAWLITACMLTMQYCCVCSVHTVHRTVGGITENRWHCETSQREAREWLICVSCYNCTRRSMSCVTVVV